MEKLSKNEGAPEENKIVTIDSTSDSEYHIIDTGTKKRYIPKRDKIPMNGTWIKTEILIQALALYPDDNPTIALEKLTKEHPEVK